MPTYNIKEIELQTGIKAHTLRTWEKRYELISPFRAESQKRLYTEKELNLLKGISELKKAGQRISEIAKLDETEILKAIKKEVSPLKENCLDYLTNCIASLNEPEISKMIDYKIEESSFEDMIKVVLCPLQERMNLMRFAGTISSYHVSFFNNIIRHKTIACKDLLRVKHDEKKSDFLFFMTALENESLTIYFMQYLLKKSGHNITNIGYCNFDEVCDASRILNTKYIVTNINMKDSQESSQKDIERLSALFPDKNIIISGIAAINLNIHRLDNVELISGSRDMASFIDRL